MNIIDFRKEILDEVALESESNCSTFTDEYINYVTNLMIDLQEIDGYEECYFEKTGKQNKKIMIDGYSFDPIDNTYSIFIANVKNEENMATITSKQIDTLYNRMKNFIEHSLNKFIQENCEESENGYTLACDIEENINKISKFRFYIITDEMLSDRIKVIEKEKIYDKPVELNVWDIGRVYANVMSTKEKETIEIDLIDKYKKGINCIRVNECGYDEYQAFLAIIPGDMLADLYITYGARLLEGNVRSFLSVRGKVNKSIRNTIINEPNMFFAYNNGIAATASQIGTELRDGNLVITKLKDLQIINGGQTTASIANAVLKKETDATEIFVPMKLSIIRDEKIEEVVPQISRCANSQNKVDDADFFSNHPYHIRIEEYSRKITTPYIDGNQYGTIWFYERARGQFVQEQMKLTLAQKKKFLLRHPKNQVIKKVELAKYLNAMNGLPHIVSKGTQYNMRNFADKISKEWEKDNSIYNEKYYKNVISLAIIYRETEKLVLAQDWYKEVKSYRANVVAYTISILFYIIKTKYPKLTIDFNSIWAKQKMYLGLKKQILVTTKEVFDFINREDRLTLNVTEWCKKEECWKRAQKHNWTINDSFIDSLVSKESEKIELSESRKIRKLDNQLNYEIELVNLGEDYWKKVYDWGKNNKILSYNEDIILKKATNYLTTGIIPTDKEAKRVFEIRERLYQEGLKKE